MRRIKELRLAKGVRQVDMAAYFHVSQSTIVSWEGDGTYPPCRLMPDLCNLSSAHAGRSYKGEKEVVEWHRTSI